MNQRKPAQTDPLDRALIGKIIEREIPRNRNIRNIQGLANETRLSRDTIYRAINAGPNVTVGTFARIEAELGLPSDTLITAGKHDLRGLVELGCPAELIEWVRKEIAKSGTETDLPGASAI